MSNGKNTDISFMIGDKKFNYRVAALVLCDDYVLLHKGITDDFWNMPGGRVKVGECAEKAIKRELLEEINTTFENIDLINVSENFFTYAGIYSHEMLFVFKIEIDKTHNLFSQKEFKALDNKNLIYKWFLKTDALKENLKPMIIYDFLKNCTNKLFYQVGN